MRPSSPLLLFVLLSISSLCLCQIIIDGVKLGRTFDGIGGLSGGGCTSRLLVDYDEPYRSQVLDYLFLPNFGASLQILKVEIGGDCQTTDGTEPSHMHTRDDENYNRGYEWWLLKEAKKRNPDIITYGLSWGVPGWIGNGKYFSQDNIDYQIKWLQGALKYHNVSIDYIGIWNERDACGDSTCSYPKQFRKGLDAAGFSKVKLVAADGGWDFAQLMTTDKDLYRAVQVIGVHYPGTTSPDFAVALNKTLWASEDYSTFSNQVGSGCWARILNENWVTGYMTSTISWNLVASYYPGLPFTGDGLMWAYSPWSGNYEVTGTIWGSAHTTQFTKPGWVYLAHGSGSGKLPKGGSYVTLVPPNNQNGDFSLVIETMAHDDSYCIRPNLPAYDVEPQSVTFKLIGGLKTTQLLHAWYTHYDRNSSQRVYFKQLNDVNVNSDGTFTLNLDVNSIVTISTTTGQKKGQYPPPPNNKKFPLPYSDNFDTYPVDYEAKYFMDQTGVWEIFDPNHSPQNSLKYTLPRNSSVYAGGKVMRQQVTQHPISWCDDAQSPISLIGDRVMCDATISSRVLIETVGIATLGARVPAGGCGNLYTSGYYFSVNEMGQWTFFAGLTGLLKGSVSNFGPNQWHTLSLSLVGITISGYVDGVQVFTTTDTTFTRGWVAIGSSWSHVQFDDFSIINGVFCTCGNLGNKVVMSVCDAYSQNSWSFESDGTIRLSNSKSLCLDADAALTDVLANDEENGRSKNKKVKGDGKNLHVNACDASKSTQKWNVDFKSGKITPVAWDGYCLDATILNGDFDDCGTVSVWTCNGGTNQLWSYDAATGQLINDSSQYLCVSTGN